MSKPLSEYTKEELIDIIGSLKKQKKFGLVWEDKPEKVATDCEQKLPVVKEVPEKAINEVGEDEPTNLIIEGDNYHALSVLNYTHPKGVDVIYIDPPYNTKSKDFMYNDRYVDIEDAFRHSKWLSFMDKRLRLAKKLLSKDWVLFISIDDNELAPLRIMCDELFGERNFVGNIGWESKTKSQNTKSAFDKLQPKIEHILCYASGGTKHHFNLISNGEREYPFTDEKGQYREYQLEVMGAGGMRGRTTMVFEIDGVNPPDGQQWKLGKDKIDMYRRNGDLFIRNSHVIIKMRPEDERSEKMEPFWGFFSKDIGTAESGKKELSTIIGKDHGFETVKPTDLIERLCFHSTKKDSVVLDFFAGSGTTGQSVLALNRKDGGQRRFIMCTDNKEQEGFIADNITYPRIFNVTHNFVNKDGKQDVLPANVRYFKTEFVEKDDTPDVLRRKLSPACEDMIRIREGAFNQVVDEELFKVYRNSRGLTAVVFDRFDLQEYIDRLEEMETDTPIHLYVFSYSKNNRLDELHGNLKHNYESQPIPEGVLEIYKRIFKNSKGGK